MTTTNRPKEGPTSGGTGDKKYANNNSSSPTLDLSPQDLKKYLSQPVRAIFHEQAKSIVAIQVRLRALVFNIVAIVIIHKV